MTSVLYPLGVSPDKTTAVGIQSGAYMSMQLHFIYSDIIKGAGLLSGGAFSSYEFLPKKVPHPKTYLGHVQNIRQEMRKPEQHLLEHRIINRADMLDKNQ